ncbi:Hypothetical protein POVR1_LOCUS584 [uncultured virus]|nr:Hypothetical protein POVR1_LOCUS584 [uncultured virus]
MCDRTKYIYDYVIWPRGNPWATVEARNGIADLFFHPPTPPNNCSCIIVKYDVLEGISQGVLVYYGETWYYTNGEYVISQFGTATICPSDRYWGQSMVLRIISDSARGGYVKFNVSVTFKDIPPAPSSVCTVPSSLVSTHRCLTPGILSRLSPLPGQTYIRMVIDPPAGERCGAVTFWGSSVEHLMSTNPWVSPKNSSEAFRVSRWSSPDGRPWPSLYSFCLQPNERLYVFALSSIAADFMVETAKDWLILRPLVDFPPPDYYRRLFSAITAVCPGRNYTAHQAFYSVSETMETGSANLRAVYPSEDFDFTYPPPFFAASYYYQIRNVPILQPDPNRLIVSLFLKQRLLTRSQPLSWTRPWFQNAYEWLTDEEWENCTLKINGKIAGADGSEVMLHVTADQITGGLSPCNPTRYAEASSSIDQIQQVASDGSLTTAYRLWFLQDRIAASNDFYACKAQMNSYFETTRINSKVVTTNQCVAPDDSTEFTNDSCCLLNETTLYNQCLPRSREIIEQYKISDYSDDLKTCPTHECAQQSLTKLVLQYNLEKDPTACTNTVERPADQNVYYQCIERFWGKEPVTHAGLNCTHDFDCPNSKCNVYSHRCFANVSDVEPLVISCIYDNITQYTRTFVSNALGINPSDPNIKALWFEKFSSLLACSDPYIPVGFNVQHVIYARCVGCNFPVVNSTVLTIWSVSPGSSFSSFGYSCWAPGSSSCSRSIAPLPARTYCAIQGCNHLPFEDHAHFPFISPASDCSNKTFCGVSDDQFFYNDVTSIIPLNSCNGATLCILANGTQLMTANPTVCQSIYSCDAVCPNCDANQCQNAGSCSDGTDYDIGIWRERYKNVPAGCFFKIRYRHPFNPTALICESPMRNTILGCSVYPTSFQINQSSCESGNFSWGDPTILELINPRWIRPARSETECLNYGQICRDPNRPQPAGVPTHTNIYSFTEECINQEPLFKWTRGRWLPGQPRSTEVVIGKLSNRFSNQTRIGLNLPRILANLTRAVDSLQSLKIRSTAFCRSAYKKSLDELICTCLAGYNESFCYTKRENITSIGVACDEVSTIQTGDLKIETAKTSLPPATCDNLYISTSSIVEYQKRTILPLRTLLVNYQEDSEFAIRNEKLGIYGKVLTDGYSMIFETTIRNVTICISPSVLRIGYESGTYSRLDLAKRPVGSFSDDLVPMELPVSTTNQYLCAQIDQLEPDMIYYFIQRVNADYTTVERTVFSSGVVVYIAVELALYCLGLLFAIIKLGYLIYGGILDSNLFSYGKVRLTIVLFLVITFFLFRVILFSLLLNQGLLGSASSRAVSYLLFEFPIVLFFAFVVNYICIWLTGITYIKDLDVNFQKKIYLANYLSIALVVTVFVIFIIFIILFQTIIFEPYFICGSSILLYDSEDSRALLLAYRITFSSISIIVGCFLFATALKYGHLLSQINDDISSWMITRLYLISIVGGFGLIGQAIYFLVITITDTTPNNYGSLTILLVLEIIPALLFVFVETIAKPKNSTAGTLFGGSSKKSSKSSGTSKDPNSKDSANNQTAD